MKVLYAVTLIYFTNFVLKTLNLQLLKCAIKTDSWKFVAEHKLSKLCFV